MRRSLLVALLALVALNAFGGGIYGLAGAEGVPTAWLDGSPFASYLVPSAILLVVVGGAFVVATIAVVMRARHARSAALGAAVIALGWIAAQLAIIGYVSWLQPAVVAAALAVVLLSPAASSSANRSTAAQSVQS